MIKTTVQPLFLENAYCWMDQPVYDEFVPVLSDSQSCLAGSSAIAPRAAYIHVPFCHHHCGYCNFTVITGRDDLIDAYLAAIERELSWLKQPREVDTLYFGGGTPTYLTVEQFERLAKMVLAWHPLAAGYEWTVEANPSDLNSEKIKSLAELGVTRISLGGQSINSDKLRLLERDHSAAQVLKSINMVRAAGLAVALDLIFATPGEALSDWERDLEQALEFQPDHISTYGLTFEKGTPFWSRREHGQLREADEELQRQMYERAIDRLTVAGFEHYEVSNFAQPGCRSRHNETYWRGDAYYAVGPGASRYVNGVRETNHRSTTTYLNRVLSGESPVAEREELEPEARAREMLVFGLRRMEGVSRKEFAVRTGFEIDELVAKPLVEFVAQELLQDTGERILLTREGLLVSDAIWPELL